MDGIWEFVFSQYFWGQVVIDDGDDFDGCDTFVNSNIIGFQFGRKYATAHARWNIVGRLGSPWSLKFLYRNAPIGGQALRPLLYVITLTTYFRHSYYSSRLFRFLIELSHNFLWEISQIFCFDKVIPGIGAFLYKALMTIAHWPILGWNVS